MATLKEVTEREENMKSKNGILTIDSHLFTVSSWAFSKMFEMFAKKKKFRAVLEYDPEYDKVVITTEDV